MRGKIFWGIIGIAGTLGGLAAGRYMVTAPGIFARIVGTAALVVPAIALAYAAVSLRGQLKGRWMEYAIVGGVAAAVGMMSWWALGKIPTEAPVAHPLLTAAAQEDAGGYYLVVKDSVAQADVWADIQIQSRDAFEQGSDQRVYKGYWETSRTDLTRLRPGQQDRIVLGTVQDKPPLVATSTSPSGPWGRKLNLHFYDANAPSGRGGIFSLMVSHC